MKNTSILLSFLAIVFVSCSERRVDPEIANAFKGEYWMETTSTTMKGDTIVLRERTIWAPVSIYEEGGSLYVQTEMFGAPDTISENPEAMEWTRERPDFAPRSIKADDEEGVDAAEDTIEIIVLQSQNRIFVVNGFILGANRSKLARSFPIKVKSGSETVLNLEAYKPINAEFINEYDVSSATMKVWYDYGPLVKDGDSIKWEVVYRDDLDHTSPPYNEYDRVIHKNILYKK